MKTRHFVLWTLLLLFFFSATAKSRRSPGDGWELVWEDNFRGHKLSYVWSKIPRMPPCPEWNKYMSTDDRLFKVKGGKLTLYGIVNDILPNDTAHYLTGGVWTKNRKLFYRGRIDVRLKMDNASGAWPAVWLMPEIGRWPHQGEIDIMERLNDRQDAFQTVHSAFTHYDKRPDKPESGFAGPIYINKYNIYSVELYEDSLRFLINNTYVGTYRRQPEFGPDQYPFDRPMYLLIDMQLGGSWVGPVKPEELPYKYKIDYVKFYRKK